MCIRDSVKLARLGLSMTDLGNAVQTALGGNAVGGFYEGERRFDLTLRFAAPFRNSVEDVSAVAIALPNNAGTVRVADVATVEVREGASRIARESGEMCIRDRVLVYPSSRKSLIVTTPPFL